MMPREVSGYSGEVIELSKGKFRYWFYSDVATGNTPTYPLSGAYEVSERALFLGHDKITRPRRTAAVVNGVDVLWRKDGLELWEKEKRIHPYAVLIRAGDAPGGTSTHPQPSLYALYTEDMRTREAREHAERYNDQPPEVRAILRARSREDDPELSEYTAAIIRARQTPDPKLIQQLVSLMGYRKPHSIEARSILERIYLGAPHFGDPEHPLNGDEKKLLEALQVLIAALSNATERDALESTLMVFLRASGSRKMDLAIPEAGVRVRLEYRPDGAQSYGSGALEGSDRQPKSVDWKAEMPAVIKTCQAWCNEQLSK